jgi:hypothetical protein
VAVNDASGTDALGGGWAVPIEDVVNKTAIERAIDAMNPVDPMSDKPALTAAYNVLQHTNARITHIIVLGDGDAEDSYSALVAQVRKAGITITTVLVAINLVDLLVVILIRSLLMPMVIFVVLPLEQSQGASRSHSVIRC